MTAHEALQEVVTLPEAVAFADTLGYVLDRSNLLRYAQTGRLTARKSAGTWLTTRSAVQALIVDLVQEPRGRPRPSSGQWQEVVITPELEQVLLQIDQLQETLAVQPKSREEEDTVRRGLIVEAIYHTNRIEGNQLSLAEVRGLVESIHGETSGIGRQSTHEQQATRRAGNP